MSFYLTHSNLCEIMQIVVAHRERWFEVFENLLCYSRLPKAERQSLAGFFPAQSLTTRRCARVAG
jgi:hypothetical protein